MMCQKHHNHVVYVLQKKKNCYFVNRNYGAFIMEICMNVLMVNDLQIFSANNACDVWWGEPKRYYVYMTLV